MNAVQYRQYICDKVKQSRTDGSAWVDATTQEGVDLRLKITPISHESEYWRRDMVNIVYKHKGRVYLGCLDSNCHMLHGELWYGGQVYYIKGTYPKCRYLRPRSEMAYVEEVHVKSTSPA